MNKDTRRAMDVQDKPVVEVAHSGYQPTRDELEADVTIDTTLAELARRALRPVSIRTKN